MELSFLLLSCFMFLIVTAQDNVCSRPELDEHVQIEGLQRFFSPGSEVVLSCQPGYSPYLGPRNIVCSRTGKWTTTKFTCIPVHCPNPDPPVNGQVYYEDTVHQSTVNFTCDDGYILIGARSAVCLISGIWDAKEPQCKSVSCGPAPIPQFGMIVYDKIVRGNIINYGVTGTYKCHPPFALIGNEWAACTASGQWTETPICQEVSCPPPENIENGYMSITEKRDFAYKETVNYGCNGDYELDGGLQIICQKNGEWSEKPVCKAPCTVGIERGRILYKGQKLWIGDFKPNRVLHKETVSVYCKNTDEDCGYAVSIQCLNGTLQLPGCFEEPSAAQYNLKPSLLPSEIKQC